MPNEPPDDDLKTMWRNQPDESSPMTVEQVRRKARELQTKTRYEFFSNTAMSLALITCCAWFFAAADNPGQKTGFAVAIAWSLIAQFATYKKMWSPQSAGDAPLANFCRRLLEQRRARVRHVWLWVGPTLLAIGSFFLPMVIRNPAAVRKMMPFLVLLLAWVVALLVIRSRQIRKIQQEIDELITPEKESGSG